MKLPQKLFIFDVETTGRNSYKNDITQLSGMIEVDGKVVEKFNFRCQPLNWDNIEPEALEVTGVGIDQLKTFDPPKKVYNELIKLLGRHCDKFNRDDKFYFIGYNVSFDVDFLSSFFRKQGDKYFGSWFNWKKIDPLPILHWMEYRGMISLENYKLSTVCEHYGIKIDAHDAMSDILATRELLERIEQLFEERPF